MLLLSSCLGGCGTYFNMAGMKCSGGEKDIYGGVQADVVQLAGACPPWTVLCGLIDFPFSLVADTLTLPWTIDATARRPARDPIEKDREK